MSQLLSKEFDLAQFSQGYLAKLAEAADLGALAKYAVQALGALLPAHQHELRWLDNLEGVALPDEAALTLLREGAPACDAVLALRYMPVRAAGNLIGVLCVSPLDLSAEQELGLGLLCVVLGPAYLALRLIPPPPLERRKAALRSAIDHLRGAQTVQPLLHDVCALVRSVLPFDNAGCALRYRDSNWLEMAYLMAEAHTGPESLYWHIDTGLAGLVIKSRRSLYTLSYHEECQRRGVEPTSSADGVPIHAWMGVPLRDNGTIFGTLVAFSSAPDVTLSPDDQDLLLWLADELSGLIRGAQRFERVEEESRRREGLIRITRALNSSLDPEYVPTLIVERAPVLLDSEEGSLLLLDEETGELVFRYAAGPAGQQLLGLRLPMDKGIAGYVASTGQALIVNNVESDWRFFRGLDGETGFNTRAILAVPLRGLDGIKGVIEVLNRRDDAPFTEDDRVLLEALGDQAMIALENARKFASVDEALARRVQDLDRSNDRLQKILRASNAIRAERQLAELLPQIAAVVRESSGFRSAMIALVQRERTPEPFLWQAAIAGVPTTIVGLRDGRVPLSRFETLLRPEFRRGTVTYLLVAQGEDYAWLRTHAMSVNLGAQEPVDDERHGAWRPGDILFCLLRNSRGELSGIIGFDNPEDGTRPGEAQVQILEILANQTAAAIENARLYAEQQSSLNRMLALNGLGRAISTTLRSPEQIYELTASGMQEMSDANWAAVVLGDPQSADLAVTFHTGLPGASAATALELADEAITARRPSSRRPPIGVAGEAIVAVPLRGSSRVFGAICVGYRDGLPSPAEAETLILFASQAATAVESMRLLGEVQEGRDQLASIMASTREGILLVGESGRVAVANEAFVDLADGVRWAEPVGAPADLADLPMSTLIERWQRAASFPPAELEQLAGGAATVADGLEIYVRGELNSMLASQRALEWTILRATLEGDSAGDESRRWPILLTTRDITAAKETERLRSDLTNMMVHDLRSPLTSILTSIDMIFRGISGEVPTTQREILTIAYTSAQNVLNMVNLLLDISRLEGGRMPLDRTALAVEGLVERAANRMSVIARNKQIALDVTVSPGAAYVYADSELVLRVLQNLLDNALKFSPKGGTIVLAADVVPGDATTAPTPLVDDGAPFSMDRGRAVRFAVTDNGVGIKAADLEKIFQKFGQVGNRRTQGTGLGLTFCKLVVEAHGGKIWVESAPGVGSTFAFTMPAAIFEEEV